MRARVQAEWFLVVCSVLLASVGTVLVLDQLAEVTGQFELR